MNPMITFSAVLAGICPVSRGIPIPHQTFSHTLKTPPTNKPGVLYLCAQTLGAALAGGVLTGVWGQEKAAAYVLPIRFSLHTLTVIASTAEAASSRPP